jgi:U3 small nucleolar RNA-associated protein 14
MYYDQTVKTLEKWDDSVKRFKVAPQTDLRNVNEKINIVPTEARSRKLGTELEKELDAILHGSEYIPDEGEELSRAEKNILNSVSIEEAAMRRIELQKHRHLQCKKNFHLKFAKLLYNKALKTFFRRIFNLCILKKYDKTRTIFL